MKWLNVKHFPKRIAEQGCTENHIKLTFEKTFSRIVFTSKKRYIGRYSHYKGTAAKADSKPEVKGLEYKRGDTTFLARRLQGQVIDLLVGGMTWKDAEGKVHPYNPGIETPTEELEIYHAVLSKMRDHVLTEQLPREEVRLSKSLSGSPKTYDKKKCPGCKKQVPVSSRMCPKCDRPLPKNDDGEAVGDLSHVAVAKIMEARGQEVGERTRIEYVVVDGSESPHKVIPADDYNGDCDRYFLWENLVFPPTMRLLEAAFPEHDWKSWHKVRPKKPRASARVLEGQLGLGFAPSSSPRGDDLAVPAFSLKVLTVTIPESAGKEAIDRVRKVLAANPGARPVEIVIELDSGAKALLSTPYRVTTGPALADAVARAVAPQTLS